MVKGIVHPGIKVLLLFTCTHDFTTLFCGTQKKIIISLFNMMNSGQNALKLMMTEPVTGNVIMSVFM